MYKDSVSIYQLVQSCAQGDLDALKTFFEIYSEDIYNFPIKVFHLTEDDAGDFFIYAYERLRSGKRFHTYAGKSSFKTWFYSVLRNMLIDWKRTKKEIQTSPGVKVNQDGVEYSSIEAEPDKIRELKKEASEESGRFYEALKDIKLENRVIFKISYIYYLNLNRDEMEYIRNKTGYTDEEINRKVMDMREALSDREIENIKAEEKITSIYRNIQQLKDSIRKDGSDNVYMLGIEKEKLQHAIDKKYDQIRRLQDKRDRGHFLARTPYKMVSALLQIPEGGISVTLLRIAEKIEKKMKELDNL